MVVLAILAAVNAACTTWATVQDTGLSVAVARSFGATPADRRRAVSRTTASCAGRASRQARRHAAVPEWRGARKPPTWWLGAAATEDPEAGRRAPGDISPRSAPGQPRGASTPGWTPRTPPAPPPPCPHRRARQAGRARADCRVGAGGRDSGGVHDRVAGFGDAGRAQAEVIHQARAGSRGRPDPGRGGPVRHRPHPRLLREGDPLPAQPRR